MKRFWRMVDIRSPGECWNWLAGKHARGYGRFRRGGGQRDMAHRIAWELTNGPIPDGLWVLHHCDNRACCNPAHLFLGTHRMNTLDMVSKDRQAKGERISIGKLKAQDIPEIRRLLRKGLFQSSIARRFGVSQHAISSIKTGRTWRHIP